MGKVMRLKGDLDDVQALLEIVSVLKDVSTNRFFTFAQKKANYQRFLETFMGYFGLLGRVDTACPLVKNSANGTDIVVMASDQGFMSQLNSRVCSAALKEYQANRDSNVICLGRRAADKCKQLGMVIERIFTFHEIPDRYAMALAVREYLIERMLKGESGKAVVVHLWAKNFNILKPRVVTLLPAAEILSGSADDEGQGLPVPQVADRLKFIAESSIDDIMRCIADIWVHSRLFEIIFDLQLVEFAAQSQQLESAMEGLSTEKKALTMSFRKASREELNKAMREVFTQASMIKRK